MWIKRFLFVLCLLLWYPAITLAYTVTLEDGTVLEEEAILQGKDYTQIHYGPVSVNYGSKEIESIKFKNPPVKNRLSFLSMVGIAEAAGEPTEVIIQDYLVTRRTIKHAKSISDIKSVIEPEYYSLLEKKVASGVHEMVVLELMRNLMPTSLEIVDTEINELTGRVAVKGKNDFGDMYGIITMVKSEGIWRLRTERWYSDDRPEREIVAPLTLMDEKAICKFGLL